MSSKGPRREEGVTPRVEGPEALVGVEAELLEDEMEAGGLGGGKPGKKQPVWLAAFRGSRVAP